MGKQTQKDRDFIVFRVLPEDRELLRTLGQGPGEISRHDVLTELVKYLPPAKEKLQPLRLGIPTKLHIALKKRSKAIGKTQIELLLNAAKKYREDFPLEE